MKQKLVYILPELSQASHMKYNAEFICELANREGLDIKLIVERGGIPDGSRDRLGVTSLHYTGNKLVTTRIIKLAYFLLTARFQGYKKVYVHYSFAGALLSSFIPNTEVYYWNCGMPFTYKRSFFTNWYQKLVYKKVDYFVTGTNELLKKYSEFYNLSISKGVIIPNWIDVTHWREQIKDVNKQVIRQKYQIGQGVVVVFSNQRLSERKGAHYLADIAESLPEGCLLVISNDGPYKLKIIEDLTKNKCINKVLFVGKLGVSELQEIFAISDIFILPSDEEGMSHSLLEAMASGLPMVTYDVGANKEMLGNASEDFVITAKDLSSFILSINSLATEEEVRIAQGQTLANKVLEYDKKKATELFMKCVIMN